MTRALITTKRKTKQEQMKRWKSTLILFVWLNTKIFDSLK